MKKFSVDVTFLDYVLKSLRDFAHGNVWSNLCLKESLWLCVKNGFREQEVDRGGWQEEVFLIVQIRDDDSTDWIGIIQSRAHWVCKWKNGFAVCRRSSTIFMVDIDCLANILCSENQIYMYHNCLHIDLSRKWGSLSMKSLNLGRKSLTWLLLLGLKEKGKDKGIVSQTHSLYFVEEFIQ